MLSLGYVPLTANAQNQLHPLRGLLFAYLFHTHFTTLINLTFPLTLALSTWASPALLRSLM
jgi:hypothetical protein